MLIFQLVYPKLVLLQLLVDRVLEEQHRLDDPEHPQDLLPARHGLLHRLFDEVIDYLVSQVSLHLALANCVIVVRLLSVTEDELFEIVPKVARLEVRPDMGVAREKYRIKADWCDLTSAESPSIQRNGHSYLVRLRFSRVCLVQHLLFLFDERAVTVSRAINYSRDQRVVRQGEAQYGWIVLVGTFYANEWLRVQLSDALVPRNLVVCQLQPILFG